MSRNNTAQALPRANTDIAAVTQIPALNTLVTRTALDLLGATEGFHVTQAHRDEMVRLRDALDAKRSVLTSDRDRIDGLVATQQQIVDEYNTRIVAYNAQVVALDSDCRHYGLVPPPIPPYVRGGALPMYRVPTVNPNPAIYTPRDWTDIRSHLDTLYRTITRDHGTLVASEVRVAAANAEITRLNGIIARAALDTIDTNLTDRLATMNALIGAMDNYNLTGDTCTGQMEGDTYAAYDDLMSPGYNPTRYELRNERGLPMRTVAVGGHNCYQIPIQFANGTTQTRLIRETDIVRGAQGQITIPQNLVIYDGTGTPVNINQDYSFVLYPTAEIDVPSGAPAPAPATITAYNSKALTVRRAYHAAQYVAPGQYAAHIDALQVPVRSTIATSIDTAINHAVPATSLPRRQIQAIAARHPSWATLAPQQQDALTDQLLGTAIPGNPNGDIQHIIQAGQLYHIADLHNPAVPGVGAHTYDALRNYIATTYTLAATTTPKLTPADVASPTTYRTWITNNMQALTTAFLEHHYTQILGSAQVSTLINTHIGQFVNHINLQYLQQHTNAPGRAGAMRADRHDRPEEGGLFGNIFGAHRNYKRILNGTSSSVNESITYQDGTVHNYTIGLEVLTKSMRLSLTLPGQTKPTLILGKDHVDILHKVLRLPQLDQRTRTLIAFASVKALVKNAQSKGILLQGPINQLGFLQRGEGAHGNHHQYRIELDDQDRLRIGGSLYNPADFTYTDVAAGPHQVFDESDEHHKNILTPQFVGALANRTNELLNRKHKEIDRRIHTPMSLNTMNYNMEKRFVRKRTRRFLNRNEAPAEGFSFDVQAGDKQANVNYEPNGKITIQVEGQRPVSGKNLAKLLNSKKNRYLRGLAESGQRIIDGLEMDIMRGIYQRLTGQLMANDRVNRYTYVVADRPNDVAYTIQSDGRGGYNIGVIEDRQASGQHPGLPLLPRQRTGKYQVLPTGVRELTDAERTDLLANPRIMDQFFGMMDRSMDEVVRMPMGFGRGASISAHGLATGAAAAVGLAGLGAAGVTPGAAGAAGLAAGSAVNSTVGVAAGAVSDAAAATGSAIAEGARATAAAAQGFASGLVP